MTLQRRLGAGASIIALYFWRMIHRADPGWFALRPRFLSFWRNPTTLRHVALATIVVDVVSVQHNLPDINSRISFPMSWYELAPPESDDLAGVKELAGRQICRARRHLHITQQQLSRATGISVRWLREMEGGNPKSQLEDYLLCFRKLGLAPGDIVLPLLFYGRQIPIPRQLMRGQSLDLEQRCVDLISENCAASAQGSRIVRG